MVFIRAKEALYNFEPDEGFDIKFKQVSNKSGFVRKTVQHDFALFQNLFVPHYSPSK